MHFERCHFSGSYDDIFRCDTLINMAIALHRILDTVMCPVSSQSFVFHEKSVDVVKF